MGVVSYTLLPLYPQCKKIQVPIEREVGWVTAVLNPVTKIKIPTSTGSRTPFSGEVNLVHVCEIYPSVNMKLK
jgi:hypothetical protein